MRADSLKDQVVFLPVSQTTADNDECDAADEKYNKQSN
jgi:hypothetical protein